MIWFYVDPHIKFSSIVSINYCIFFFIVFSLAAWILDLLSLPTKFVTKKLRELRSVFQSSFHHAPCIKVSTKGPLSLKDLQTLTPSQSKVLSIIHTHTHTLKSLVYLLCLFSTYW